MDLSSISSLIFIASKNLKKKKIVGDEFFLDLSNFRSKDSDKVFMNCDIDLLFVLYLKSQFYEIFFINRIIQRSEIYPFQVSIDNSNNYQKLFNLFNKVTNNL